MRFAILMNNNSYVGREYLHALSKVQIRCDVLVIEVGNGTLDEFEDQRCGGLWVPSQFEVVSAGLNVFHFKSLNDSQLLSHLTKSNYDIGIQGGVGILKSKVIDQFKNGILNFHPGKLPFYRGCTTPEWQLFENKKVVATCHLIAEGIDSGAILAYNVLSLDYSTYERMRSTIYPMMGLFLVDVLTNLLEGKILDPKPQDNKIARYYKPIPEKDLLQLKQMFPLSFH